MAWVSLISVALIGGLGRLLSQRQPRSTMTQHTLSCPLHNRSATVTVRTRAQARRRRRYVDVTACSLLPQEPVVYTTRVAWCPDTPYYELYMQKVGQYPRQASQVPCRKDCLRLLNGVAGSRPIHPIHCTSGTTDGLELVQQAIRNPAITRLLWFTSV